MNRLFEDATRQHERTDAGADQDIERADWTPRADVYDRDTELVIMIDLPGIEKDSLDIGIENDRLSIRGTRNVEPNGKQRLERNNGRFYRRFGPLSQSIDQAAISATYKEGVLEIRLPKRARKDQRRVEIKVN
jgi:HSP20 family protein